MVTKKIVIQNILQIGKLLKAFLGRHPQLRDWPETIRRVYGIAILDGGLKIGKYAAKYLTMFKAN